MSSPSRRLLECVFVLAALSSACRKPPPNLVLITVDTLRADRLGTYGYAGQTSPRIDALAAQGIVFEDASTPIPRTTQAIASLFTGRAPYQHGVAEIGERLPDRETTLAEILRSAGYQTAAISANAVAGRRQGLDQGFDSFLSRAELMQRYRFPSEPRTEPASNPRGFAEAVTREAIHWLAKRPSAKGPYFLWLFYFDPHWRYQPPRPYDQVIDWSHFDFYRDSRAFRPKNATIFYNLNERSARARPRVSKLYDAEVHYTDTMIGRLLDAIPHEKKDRDTLIVFTADHGESLGEHGYYYEHGDFVYQPTIRVPFIVSYPGRLEIGKRIPSPVSTLDLVPTLLSLMGIAAPAEIRFSGRDLSAALRDPEHADKILGKRILISESGSALLAQNPLRRLGGRRSIQHRGFDHRFRYAREGPWLLLSGDGPDRLYRVSEDPMLEHDRAKEQPGLRTRLRHAIDALPFLAARWYMVRDARWKLIYIPEPKGIRYVLYDLEHDPEEGHDLSADEPAIVARLRKPLEARLRAVRRRSDPNRPGQTPEEQQEIERQLRSLGYIE